MLQFNLLPDIKQEHIRAQRLKQTVVTISGLVAIAAVTVLVLLFLVVNVLQKKHLHDVNGDIKNYSGQLQSIPDLNQILTVQNQLNSLPNLHDQKPAASRLFSYLSQLVPAKVTMDSLNIDFTQYTINITGEADSLSTVNQFVDTLKFSTYSNGSGATSQNAFSNVVLTSFGLNATSNSGGKSTANYSVTASFDKAIFDNTQNITLTVPNKITTRSNLDAPTDLFTGTTKQGTQ